MKNPLQQLWGALGGALGVGASAPEVEMPGEWLAPISEAQPSGPSLEYDPQYVMLGARLAPKAQVQYGQFIASAAEPDWKEIERDCRALLLRSKDIGLLLWYTRGRTRQGGAHGLLQGLGAMQRVCELFEHSVHPQIVIDGEREPLVRANALAALCDPEGLLEDVREVVIVATSAHRLSVRDVERALAVPRAAYAMDPAAVQRQLADLHQRGDVQLQALATCALCVQALQTWAQHTLGDDAPSLAPLLKLLKPLLPGQPISEPGPKVQAEALDASALGSGMALSEPLSTAGVLTAAPLALVVGGPGVASVQQSREEVRQALAQVRGWIEVNEPSSPVAVLLKQAERMWGKRFSEVAHLIPPDLLQAWDRDD